MTTQTATTTIFELDWIVANTPQNNAYEWGFAEATAGTDQEPSACFTARDSRWHAYNAGYLAGLENAEVTGPRLDAARWLIERTHPNAAALAWWL